MQEVAETVDTSSTGFYTSLACRSSSACHSEKMFGICVSSEPGSYSHRRQDVPDTAASSSDALRRNERAEGPPEGGDHTASTLERCPTAEEATTFHSGRAGWRALRAVYVVRGEGAFRARADGGPSMTALDDVT